MKFDNKRILRVLLLMGIGDWGLGIGDWANPQSPKIDDKLKHSLSLAYHTNFY
jgi:hypothetical protein